MRLRIALSALALLITTMMVACAPTAMATNDDPIASQAMTLETAQNVIVPCGLWKGTNYADALLRHAARPGAPDLAQYPVPGSLAACSSLVRLTLAGEPTASAEFVNVSVVFALPPLGANGIGTSPSSPADGTLKIKEGGVIIQAQLAPGPDDIVLTYPGEDEKDLRFRCTLWDGYLCGTLSDGRPMVCYSCRCAKIDGYDLCDR